MAVKLDADFILASEEIKQLLEELTQGLGDADDKPFEQSKTEYLVARSHQ